MSICRLFILIGILAFSSQLIAVSESLGKETDSEVPLAGINASLQPDLFTGTLTGSIPIEVPPGRNGMQPNLVLSYASSGGNSWTGMGWKLEMGTIERQTKWGVLYSPSTQEELDGKVYTMRLNGVSMDLVRDATVTTRYYAKVENAWARITKLATGWEVTDTKGTKYIFGTIAGTRVQSSDGTKIFKWCLEKIVDRDGNYLTVSYVGDQGQGYLSQIQYGGNDGTGGGAILSHTNTVKFYLEDRSDKPVMYTSYFPITTAKRLKTIEVKANGSLVRAYEMQYVQNSNWSNSLLTTIKLFGRDALVSPTTGVITGTSSAPTTSLIYQSEASTFNTSGATWQSAFCSATDRLLTGDFNGDGKLDVLCNQNGTATNYVRLSTGAAFVAGPNGVVWGSPFCGSSDRLFVADFNGDGKADLLCNQNTTANNLVVLSTGTGFTGGTSWVSAYCAMSDKLLVADFNGDGKADLLCNQGGTANNYVQLSTGAAFVSGPNGAVWLGAFCGSSDRLFVADVNGDGKADLVCNQNTTANNLVVLSTGTGFTGGTSWVSAYCAMSDKLLVADFNGDGKADLLCNQGGTANNYVQLSTGAAFVSGPNGAVWLGAFCGSSDRLFVADVNGDGKADLVCNQNTTANNHVVLSTGTGFTAGAASAIWVSAFCALSDMLFAEDFDGDGKTDLFCFQSATSANFVVRSGPSSLPSNVLLSLVNGMGGATTVTYVSSPQHSTTSTPAHPQLPYPVDTVTAVTTCDNWNGTSCVGLSSTTSYAYDGGFHNLQYRDFRGFKHATVTGPTGPNGEKTVTETWFHQGTNLNKSDDTLTDLQTAPIAYAMGLPWKTEVKDQAGTLQGRTQTGYTNILGSTSAPFFPKALNTLREICQGPCTKQVLSEFNYNATGGLTHEWHSGDLSTATDNRTIIHTLSSNTTDWILNVPIKDQVYRGVAASGDTPVLLAQTDFYYDGTTSCGTASTNQVPTKGHLTRTVRAYFNGTSTHAAPETRMAYNSYGSISCARDAKGNTSTITYDSATNTFPLTSTTASPASLTTTTSYYGVNGVAIPATGFYGQVQSVTDPNGRVTTHEYDALGRRTKATNPDGFFATTTYNYGAGQTVGTQHVLMTNSLGHSSATYFDGLGRGTRKTNTYTAGPTRETKTEYNGRGQVLRTSLPYFTGGTIYWQTMTYDALGRVLQVATPGSTTTVATSQSCYSDWTTVTIEPDGTRKRETKDSLARVVKIEEYNSIFPTTTCDTSVGTPYATTNYAYDVLGNLTQVTDAKGNVSTMAYDSLSRKKSMHDPDMGDWSYLYDANGNLTKQTDAKGQVLWFTYDTLNRRVQKDFGGTAPKALGSGDVRYTYDDTVTTFNRKGRLKQVVDAATNVTLEYDVMGRITKSTTILDSVTYVTTSVYDGLGRLSSVTYPSTPAKSLDYVYEGPYLKQVKDKPVDGTVTYVQYAGWNETGQPATAIYNVGTNQVVTTYTYQTASNATCGSKQTFRPCTTKVQKGTNPAYLDLRYAFTNGGNINDIYDQLLPVNDQHFIYDALDRLTSANGPYGSSGINATLTYAYDQIGNMTTNSQVGTYTYPTSGSTSVRPHAVSSAGLNAYAYDNNGNMTSGAGRIFEWNLENKPICIAQATGTCSAATNKTTFVYDGDGGRVKKITSTTTTRYISKLYECDTTGGTTSCSRFIFAGGTRVATVASNGTTHFWHQDHLGSSTIITDSTGAKAQALAYFPYGATRTNQSFTVPAVNVPYKYTGQELDGTGLYDYGARQYDPVLGRFISADTLVPDPSTPQALNRYAYVLNNPLRYIDPTGHFWDDIGDWLDDTFGDIGTTLVGVAVGFVTGCYTCAAAIMSHSESGRYVVTGAILTVTTVASFACGGCMGWAVGAAIGSWTGAAVGGYSAYTNGGDLSSGILFGSSIGAVTGAIGGQMVPGAQAWQNLLAIEKVAVAGLVGGTYGAGSGAAQGFAGGKGSVADILKSAGIGFGIGAATAAGLQAVAPPLSELAASLGKFRIFSESGAAGSAQAGSVGAGGAGGGSGGELVFTVGDLFNIITLGGTNRLATLATNAGQFLDANRALILGGVGGLGTGAAFNYKPILEVLREKCGADNPCTKGGSF